ncbi:histidine kinase [Pseudoflavitalea sp. X16]|nr:histidine kinase [Paraflavitalea devenefica]
MLAGLRGGITIGGLAAAIKLMKYWYVKEQRNLQLQKENAESQLQLLKAQVHPHFLFNTLNNIYSHTQGVAPVASQLVMGLSDMLRFMLYECNQPLVPLSKELTLIRDYITLEKIRYDEQFDIHLDIPTDTGNLHIAPLLLLPLVENCFKHGTSNMLEQPWLSLQVQLKEDTMEVRLMNGKAKEKKPTNSFGIGIQNVRKRLDLLYPEKHVLKIMDEEEVFVVQLTLQLERIQVARKKEENIFVLTNHD